MYTYVFHKYISLANKYITNMFTKNLNIITSAIDTINEFQFKKLLDDCESVLKLGHKIIVSGLGKNAPICEKFVGTMLSLGMNASFLHTNTAIHGDLGMIQPGDLVIMTSKNGTTSESVYLTQIIQQDRKDVKLWLLSFNASSILVDTIGLDRSIIVEMSHEGDLWNIVPNNSSTLSLIILQTLAIELSRRMGVTLSDFRRNHPGGSIGQKLNNQS